MAPAGTGCDVKGRCWARSPDSAPWASYLTQSLQVRLADSLTSSSPAVWIPVLFVCLGNTVHLGGDLTQAGEAIVFHPPTTGLGSVGGHQTQQGPVSSSSGIFQLKLREERSHSF